MLKSHEKFHSSNGRRLILVADDEAVNRELLGMLLTDEYEIIYAADGRETLDQIQSNKDELSLVLLDLMMPVIPGLDVLKQIKANEELKHIPVIVLTADQDAEIESLSIGAIDYIPKPYPQRGIILARILRAIELSEDRDIIRSTERDHLTGLYNREYFYRYAEQYDQHHKDREMDAIVVDINHFHMINERFGNAYGDQVLRGIGEKIRACVSGMDGIVCRREADTFMVYCPNGIDYQKILDDAAFVLSGDGTDESVNSRVRLRLGVYASVDKGMPVERRFDRAKLAADTVKGSFTKSIGIYDSAMYEHELYAERLVDDFHTALAEKQFQVYYQPKYDIRPGKPALFSAEALVRWQHPKLGLISPGIFIPLFEENGLIQELDRYVWRETAMQIRAWKDAMEFSIPVSVNVSRIDMYDPLLIERFEKILKESGISTDDLFLEVTESAYTQDSEQIIETVNRLREMGFRIEMDDFGTGYSSLNMISALPIDALKLDMQFVRSAFQNQKDTRMLEVIIDIADHLGVPVIAEGVETEEQLVALKDLGCDIVQGYYFSKPVPAEAFEPFLIARKTLSPEELLPEKPEEEAADVQEEEEQQPKKRAIHLRATNYIFAIMAFVLAGLLVFSDVMITRSYRRWDDANQRYIEAEHAAAELEAASDYLTESVRSFTVTGKLEDLESYFEEVNVTRRRDKALEDLDRLLEGSNQAAYDNLSSALDYSNELMDLEYQAMRLTQIAFGYSDEEVPGEVSSADPGPGLLSGSTEEMKAAAELLVFDDTYRSYKDHIRENVRLCTEQLIESAGRSVEETGRSTSRMFTVQGILMVLLMLAVLAEVLFITLQVRIPLTQMVDQMRSQEMVTPAGAAELRFVTQTYNEVLEENKMVHNQLSYEASHDMLTGLKNRSAYELFMDNADKEHIALLVIDVDNFKEINDTYGHDTGDRVLQRVAEILSQNFRSVDAVCRLGGDEFVIVMTRANSTMRQLVINKIGRANDQLQHPRDGLPKVSLSVGAAFSDRENPQGDIFKDADTALYRMKQSGRCGCMVYGMEMDEIDEGTDQLQ